MRRQARVPNSATHYPKKTEIPGHNLPPRRKKGRCQTAVMNNRKWIQFARYPQSRHRYDIRSTKDLYSSTCIWHTGTDGPYRLRDIQPMPNLNPHSPIQFLLRPEKKDQKEGLYKRSVQSHSQPYKGGNLHP